ncbi:MAG: YdaU family protein [Shewanella sp.]
MHYFQFNIGDYARDTAHLTEMEDLAYRRMLDLYYRAEGPLPSSIDEIARLIRMRSHTASIAIVLQDFFDECADGFRNHRADQELHKTYSKSEKAKASAQARWNKNKDLQKPDEMRTHSECNANDMLPITHYPLPITQDTEVKKKKPADAGIDFSPLCMTGDQIDEVKRIRRKNKGGTLTQRVINGLAKEFELAANIGWGPEDILSEWELRGWKSFKAEWVKPKGGSFDGMSAISLKNAQNLAGDW